MARRISRRGSPYGAIAEPKELVKMTLLNEIRQHIYNSWILKRFSIESNILVENNKLMNTEANLFNFRNLNYPTYPDNNVVTNSLLTLPLHKLLIPKMEKHLIDIEEIDLNAIYLKNYITTVLNKHESYSFYKAAFPSSLFSIVNKFEKQFPYEPFINPIEIIQSEIDTINKKQEKGLFYFKFQMVSNLIFK